MAPSASFKVFFAGSWLMLAGSIVIAADSPLSCLTQHLLSDGNLPDKIATEDWNSDAELAVCKAGTKWCVQYFINDYGTGTEYVSGGCEGDYLGSNVMPTINCTSGFVTRLTIPGMYGQGRNKLASFYCCQGSGCTANRQYPTLNGRGLSFSTLIPLALIIVPSIIIGGIVDYLRLPKE